MPAEAPVNETPAETGATPYHASTAALRSRQVIRRRNAPEAPEIRKVMYGEALTRQAVPVRKPARVNVAEARQFPRRASPCVKTKMRGYARCGTFRGTAISAPCTTAQEKSGNFRSLRWGSAVPPRSSYTAPLEAPSAPFAPARQSVVRAPAPSVASRGSLAAPLEACGVLRVRLSPLSVAVAAKTRRSVASRFYGLRPFSVRTLHASKTTRSRIGLPARTPAFEYRSGSGAPCGSPEAAASHSAAYGRAAQDQR